MTSDNWDDAEDLLSSSILLLRLNNNDNDNDKEMAELGAIITFSYRTYLLNEVLPSSTSSSTSSSSLNKMTLSKEIEYCDNIKAQIGEMDVVPGLELAIRYGHIGDHFKVRVSHRFVYGPAGRINANDSNNNIPPDSNLEYDVSIHNIIFNPDSCSVQDAISLRKECGNRWFSYNEFNKAAFSYSKGVKIAETALSDNDTNHEAIQTLYVACLNNLAACHLSTAQFSKAKEICIQVLEMEPENIKALLRAARTSLALHDYDECDLCLQTVLKLEPNNEQAAIEFKKLKKAKHDYKINANNMAMKMAKSIFTPPKTNIKQINKSSTITDDNDKNIDSANINSTGNYIDTNADDLAKVKAAKAAAPSNLILFLITSLLVVVLGIGIAILISQK